MSEQNPGGPTPADHQPTRERAASGAPVPVEPSYRPYAERPAEQLAPGHQESGQPMDEEGLGHPDRQLPYGQPQYPQPEYPQPEYPQPEHTPPIPAAPAYPSQSYPQQPGTVSSVSTYPNQAYLNQPYPNRVDPRQAVAQEAVVPPTMSEQAYPAKGYDERAYPDDDRSDVTYAESAPAGQPPDGRRPEFPPVPPVPSALPGRPARDTGRPADLSVDRLSVQITPDQLAPPQLRPAPRAKVASKVPTARKAAERAFARASEAATKRVGERARAPQPAARPPQSQPFPPAAPVPDRFPQPPFGAMPRPASFPASGGVPRPEPDLPSGSTPRPLTGPPPGSPPRPVADPPTGSMPRPPGPPTGSVRRPLPDPRSGSMPLPVTNPPTGSLPRPLTSQPPGSTARPVTDRPTGSLPRPLTDPPTGSLSRPGSDPSRPPRRPTGVRPTPTVPQPRRDDLAVERLEVGPPDPSSTRTLDRPEDRPAGRPAGGVPASPPQGPSRPHPGAGAPPAQTGTPPALQTGTRPTLQPGAQPAVQPDPRTEQRPSTPRRPARYAGSDPLGKATVLIVGDSYAPNGAGVAPHTTAMARNLAGMAERVVVLTGVAYDAGGHPPPGYRRTRRIYAQDGSVQVIRHRHHVPHGHGPLARLRFEASFTRAAMKTPIRDTPGLVIGVTPSIAGAEAAARLARRYGVPLLIVVQELTGLSGSRHNPVDAALAWRERAVLRRANRVLVASHHLRSAVAAAGVPQDRIERLANWNLTAPLRLDRTSARARLGWPTEGFVVLSTGNLGAKQDASTLVRAARRLSLQPAGRSGRLDVDLRPDLPVLSGGPGPSREDRYDRHERYDPYDPYNSQGRPDVHFVLAGSGSQRAALQEAAADLPAVTFMDMVTAADYPALLAAADVLVLNERSGQPDHSLAARLNTYLLAGRPVIAAVNPDGETARAVRSVRGAATTVSPGDAHGLAAAIVRLRDEPGERERMAGAAGAYAEQVDLGTNAAERLREIAGSVLRARTKP